MPTVETMSFDENSPDVLHSGRVKFKAGLINKWTTIYCTLCEGCLRVFDAPDISLASHTFTRNDSWISAKRNEKNSLFVLNTTDSNSTSSKIFLFDTESSNLLQTWLHAFKTAGWTCAITGEKLHYHRRSVDSFAPRSNTSYRDSGFGGSLRGTRSISEPTFFVSGKPIVGNDDTELYRNMKRSAPKGRKNLSSLFSEIDINGAKKSTGSDFSGSDGDSSRFETDSQELFNRGYRFENGTSSRGLNITRIDERKEIENTDENISKVNKEGANKRANNAKIVRVNEVEINPLRNFSKKDKILGNKRNLSFPEDLANTSQQAVLNERSLHKRHSDSNIIQSRVDATTFRPSRLTRFDHSKIFFDPTVSPDMKGKLLEAECRTRKTSLTRQGEHIRLSESDETEAFGNDGATEKRANHSSKLSNAIEVTNIDTGEKEVISGRTRKTSSAASEGDVDGDGNVFHNGTPGSYLSYLESGYCSKESLATNESSENRKSSATIDDEVNNNERQLETKNEVNGDLEKDWAKDEEISINSHEAIKPMPSECKNTPDADEKPNIAESGRTFSDSVTMATHLSNRSNNMKLEKRSSMSQLLSQIKDRLPGRKNKGLKKQSRKDNTSTYKSPEMLLWNNSGKWKERWFMMCESCLLLFKDALFTSPDFALDIRSCQLDVPEENKEQGFLSFKLTEKDGKMQHFAAVSEASYQSLITLFSKILQNSKHAEFNIDMISSEMEETAEMKFDDDAIIPYSECEQFREGSPISDKQANKQESIDSGTDGDISCFEGSDASNVGIDQYAAGWKDKVVRRRKTSLALQQPVISPPDEADGGLTGEGKCQVSAARRLHRTVAHCESSPPSPRTASVSYHRRDASTDPRKMMRPIDYLNVDKVERRLVKNRYSVPDFRQAKMTNNDEFQRQRMSCLEELLKLKEAHENNQYPEKSAKAAKKRAASLYLATSKSSVYDENANHRQTESLNRISPTSPPRSNSFKIDASPVSRQNFAQSAKYRNVDRSSGLSDSLNMSSSYTDTSDFADEFYEDDLRQQALLMKRRNSLRLQKQVVDQKVKALRDRVSHVTTKDQESTEEEQNLAKLEDRLENIDKELEDINLKIDLPDTNDLRDTKKKNRQLFSKFKSTQKATTPVGTRRTAGPKESRENAVTSPATSPPVRKRSFSHNFRLFGHTGKRDSDGSGLNSNTASISSIESFHEPQLHSNESVGRNTGSYGDLKSIENHKFETQRSRKASSVTSVPESDDVDGRRDADKGINREALLKIEDFEQFAVEITAKRVTDCIDI